MLDPPAARFVKLATVGTLAEGQLLAARLESEGIEVRVHSPSFGPYPLTVGEMAETELWVMSDRLGEASTILLDAEVNSALAGAEEDKGGDPAFGLELRVIAFTVAVVLAALWILRIVRVY
jgi:hypothetical protein